MILFFTSNRILYTFFLYVIVLYERFPAFQSYEKVKPCNTIKNKFGKGVIKNSNWWYTPKCKENRPDLFFNVQVGPTDRFCVNVTNGIPFYRTTKPKTDKLNCSIAMFKLNITTEVQKANMSEIIKSSLDRLFTTSIGNQITEIIAQENISKNKMIINFTIYSIGHRDVKDIIGLINSRINEGSLDFVSIDSDKSTISLITSNLEDPPPVRFDLKEYQMSMDSSEYSSGDIKKRNAIENDKSKNAGSNNLDASFVAAISIVGVAGCVIFILLILYCIYRLRKKDEGSYALNKNMVIITNDKTRKNIIMVSNTKEYFA